MPRETISIPLRTLPVYEASSIFFSTIAYPNPLDESQRRKFRIALSRWAILERATIDNQWGQAAQGIKPEIFAQGERLFFQSLDRGSHLLAKRVLCAATMILPNVTKTPLRLRGLEPTVGNLSGITANVLGMSIQSQKTIELRLWAPTKPVAHAAMAWVRFMMAVWGHNGPWDHEYELCNRELFLGAMFYSDIITMLVQNAEKWRLRLPKLNSFHINEKNTIQFSLD